MKKNTTNTRKDAKNYDVPNGLETVILKTQSVGHAEEREDNARTAGAWRGDTKQGARPAS